MIVGITEGGGGGGGEWEVRFDFQSVNVSH